MINYRTHATIKIGCKVVEEYFDIVNVEHYNTILGTPFLRKMGIVLDFRSPGMAWIGNKVVEMCIILPNRVPSQVPGCSDADKMN